MQKQKIRIRLKSYEISLLNESCEKIIDTASRTESLTMGPIPLPTRRKIYCVSSFFAGRSDTRKTPPMGFYLGILTKWSPP